MIVHATASTFVFHKFPECGWKLGLVQQPRLKRLMIAGGHVEEFETPAQAAVREVLEETGLAVDLLHCVNIPLPQGYPLTVVPNPWWTTLVDVPRDNHLPVPHQHLDHQFVAIASSPTKVAEPVHEFGWYGADELSGLRMFDDTQRLADFLFPHLDRVSRAGTVVGAAAASLLPV